MIDLSAADAEGAELTYSATVLDDRAARLAYDLDRANGFFADIEFVTNNFYANSLGLGENHFQGNGGIHEYYILPNGEIFRWGGSISGSTLVGRLDENYYNNLNLLLDAQSPIALDVKLTVEGSTLTIDPADGFLGTFSVQVTASDGIISDGLIFQVSVVNYAPVLQSIGEQRISPGGSLNVDLIVSDVEGDGLTFSAEIQGLDPVTQRAYELNRQYDFQQFANSLENDYWFNSRGHQERYLPGFFILPGGELYKWGGSIESSTYIATLDSRYHQDPSLLVNAQLPAEQLVFQLVQQYNFQLFADSLENDHYFNSRGHQERYLPGFFILPGGKLYKWGGSIESSTYIATLDSRYHQDPSLLVNAQLPAEQLAFQLDQQYNFRLFADSLENDHYFNSRGHQERYLPGFFILPGGKLYQWGGSIESSTFIATLDSRYHQDPSLLVNAQLPAAPNVSVSFNGSTLLVTPPADFVGQFEMEVSVSDGFSSSSRTFAVTVKNQDPVLVSIDYQTMPQGGSLNVDLSASDAEGYDLTYSTTIQAHDPIAQLAYNLDQQYDFQNFADSVQNDYWFNSRGHQERYLPGFFILPGGELYKWGDSIESSTYTDSTLNQRS